MPKVYVAGRESHDYSAAKDFGEVVQLSDSGPMDRYSVDSMYKKFAKELRASSSEDFIILTGLTVMSCIACSCFAYLHGRVNILLFKNNRYIPKTVDLTAFLRKGEVETLEEK